MARTPGKFPYLDKPEWRRRFVEAGLNDPRCTLDEPALRRLAFEVVDIKPLLETRGRGSDMTVLGFKDTVVERIDTDRYGTLYQLRVTQPGLGGAINPFNVRFGFDVAADPKVTPGRITPVTDPAGAPLALLEARYDDFGHLVQHLDYIEGRLASAERRRPYDLTADLEASGQIEPAIYHVVRYVAGDQVWHTVAATAGSNRTRARATLFGLTAAAGILGLPTDMLGGQEGERWLDPAAWRDDFTDRLNAAYADDADLDDPNVARWNRVAEAALNVATVPARLVIGYDPTAARHADFDAALAATNLRTHLRGPLNFSDENQALSNGRSLVDQAFADDAITAAEHRVLNGSAAVTTLGGDAIDSVMALVRLVDRIVYPADDAGRKRVRKILVEPAPSQLGKKHAVAREHIRVALLTLAIGGVDLQQAAMDTPHQATLRTGITSSGRTIDELIAAATNGTTEEKRAARAELAHLAVPGLVNGRVLLAPHGSTGDRRAVATKLAVAATTDRGVNLFVEGIVALSELVTVRAGEPAARTTIEPGKVERVGDKGDHRPADSPWFTATWPDDADGGNNNSSIESPRTPGELWAELYAALPGKFAGARSGLDALHAHVKAMVELVAPGRELATAERSELMEKLAEMSTVVSEINTVTTIGLRAPSTGTSNIDDFAFAPTADEAP